MHPKISIIFPARNESDLIIKVLEDTTNYARKRKVSFEILVVLNGITDDSAKKLEKNIGRFKETRILESEPGYGTALKKGLEEARGEFVIVFNVDFYDLNFIDLAMIDIIGKDVIIGSKRAAWSKDERPFSRRAITFGLNTYLGLVHGFKGSDTHGIKIIRRNVVKTVLPKCKTSSGIFDTEFVINAQRQGFKLMDVPTYVKETRPARFTNRIIQTPVDMWQLALALKS